MPINIPTIETERLILRGPKESDLEPMVAFGLSDRSKYVGGPYDRDKTWRAFLGGIGHWVWRGFGMWFVEHRSLGVLAGRVGMIHHDSWDEPELGWHVYDDFEGQGLAFEAALAARSYAAQHFGLNGVISYIAPENTRSLALAERLGSTYEREGTVMGHHAHVYRHPKEVL